MKLLFATFSENWSLAASMLSPLAIDRGWDVDIECVYNHETDADIGNKIEASKPDLVALTFKTFERKKALQTARIARSLGIKVLGGGLHPTYCPDDAKESGHFDGIVTGDGMGIFPDILDSFKSLDGQVILGKAHPDPFAYARRYYSKSQELRFRRDRTYQALTSLGCPFKCTFCSPGKPKLLPIESVADEIAEAKAKYDIEKVYILDNTFTYNPIRLRKFRERLEGHGVALHWGTINARVDLFNERIAGELVALGAEEIGFGIETVSPRLLEFLVKETTREEAYQAMDTCRKYGLYSKCSLVFGFPTQDREDYEYTLEWVRDGRPDAVYTFYFIPFPGSPLWPYCIEKGYMRDDFSFDNLLGVDEISQDSMGVRENPGVLKNIDYALATEYIRRIKEVDNNRKEEVMLRTAAAADREKWILFGTEDYFYRVLERLSHHSWNNLMGYHDYSPLSFKQRNYQFNVPRYQWVDRGKRPDTVVVTVHKGRHFETAILPMLRNTLDFKGKILSASSFGQC